MDTELTFTEGGFRAESSFGHLSKTILPAELAPKSLFVSNAPWTHSLVGMEMALNMAAHDSHSILGAEDKEMCAARMSRVKEHLYLSWAVKL